MRIGVVACGYADGYPRHASGWGERRAPVLVDGVRTELVGRVSMDMLCVDLTPVPKARAGTPSRCGAMACRSTMWPPRAARSAMN